MSAPTAPPVAPRPAGGFLSGHGLVRPADRKFAGVCGALGRATGTDPLLWRVLLGVLVIFNGSGLVMYAAGWLLFTSEEDEVSPLESMLGRGSSSFSSVTAALMLVGTVALFFVSVLAGSVYPYLLVVLLAVLLATQMRRHHGYPKPPPPLHAPAPIPGRQAPFAPGGPYVRQHGGYPATYPAAEQSFEQLAAEPVTAPPAVPWDAAYGVPYGPYSIPPAPPHPPAPAPMPQPPVRPKRPRSRLGLATLSLMAIGVGVVSIVATSGVAVPLGAFLAVPLAICGLGLIIGSWWGGSPMLYVVGGLLSALLAVNIVAVGVNAQEFGFRAYEPVTLAEIPNELQVRGGAAEVDLSNVDFDTGDVVNLDVDVNGGFVDIALADDDVDVIMDIRDVTAGHVSLENHEVTGGGQQKLQSFGADGRGGGTLSITVSVSFGAMEVRR